MEETAPQAVMAVAVAAVAAAVEDKIVAWMT